LRVEFSARPDHLACRSGSLHGRELVALQHPALAVPGARLLLLGVYLLYPWFETFRLSFYDATRRALRRPGQLPVGLHRSELPDHHSQQFHVAAGRAGAVHHFRTDRRRAGRPRLVGQFRQVHGFHADGHQLRRRQRHLEVRLRLPRPGSEQIGILNAIVTGMGFPPQAWVTVPFWNNFFLMAILIWIQTGFAMVILSAALRGVPTETIEAARIDGASELQIFFEIMVPQVMSTILVVWTTITITVLKVFDIVMAMTGGQWDTSVLANLMYDWMFRGGGDYGRSSTLAMVLMFAVIPVMAFNIRRFRTEEAQR
jgi:alpha-glucoside transport system permease protein